MVIVVLTILTVFVLFIYNFSVLFSHYRILFSIVIFYAYKKHVIRATVINDFQHTFAL